LPPGPVGAKANACDQWPERCDWTGWRPQFAVNTAATLFPAKAHAAAGSDTPETRDLGTTRSATSATLRISSPGHDLPAAFQFSHVRSHGLVEGAKPSACPFLPRERRPAPWNAPPVMSRCAPASATAKRAAPSCSLPVPSCNAEVRPDATFCGSCGAKLRASAPASTSAAAPARARRAAAPRKKGGRLGDWVLAAGVPGRRRPSCSMPRSKNGRRGGAALRRNLGPTVREVTSGGPAERGAPAGRSPADARAHAGTANAVGSDQDAYARSARFLALIVSPRFTRPGRANRGPDAGSRPRWAPAPLSTPWPPCPPRCCWRRCSGRAARGRRGGYAPGAEAPRAERGPPLRGNSSPNALITAPPRPGLEAAEDPLALWILGQKAIALAREDGDAAAGDQAMQRFQDDLGQELFQVVVRNVPVTDPHTGQVFTLEEYANRTYRQASEALEAQVADSVTRGGRARRSELPGPEPGALEGCPGGRSDRAGSG